MAEVTTNIAIPNDRPNTKRQHEEGDLEQWTKTVGSDISIVYRIIASGRNVLLHGHGGSGKSYALKTVGQRLVEEGWAVACTASTGCAAVGYSDMGLLGSTINHWSGIGLAKDPIVTIVKNIWRNAGAIARMKTAKILLVDEISMISAELWDKLDAVLRCVRKCNDTPFGGLIVAVSGDFMQLSPVDGKWIFCGTAWKACAFVSVEFSTPHRHKHDKMYIDLLSRARFGLLNRSDEAFLTSRIITNKNEGTVKPTTLFPRRKEAEDLNEREMEKLPGEETVYASIDTYSSKKKRNGEIPEAYMRMLDAAIPKTLRLKIGAQVMLKKNIDVERGLVNGARGVVCDLKKHTISIETPDGTVVELGKCEWDVGSKDEKATRSQIPVIMAWGLTIHASQGSTLDNVECDLGPNVFANGQAYVALSRVKMGTGLRLLRFYPYSIKSDPVASKFTIGLSQAASKLCVVLGQPDQKTTTT